MTTSLVYRFRVVLRDIAPPIWRVIEVPEAYTFWDLHVAIQDAMGWRDHHLHVFHVDAGRDRRTGVGIPDDDPFEGAPPIVPGWEVPVTQCFTRPGVVIQYDYDFGDGWEHDVVLEAIAPRQAGRRYPICIGGERACPQEDCGGVPGYEELLEVMSDPDHEEYAERLTWLGGRFDPERFDPRCVKFDDPAKRWRRAFGSARRLARARRDRCRAGVLADRRRCRRR